MLPLANNKFIYKLTKKLRNNKYSLEINRVVIYTLRLLKYDNKSKLVSFIKEANQYFHNIISK